MHRPFLCVKYNTESAKRRKRLDGIFDGMRTPYRAENYRDCGIAAGYLVGGRPTTLSWEREWRNW